MYKLTETGKEYVRKYHELMIKFRNEILEKGEDTCEDIVIADNSEDFLEAVEKDIEFYGIDEDRYYCNGYMITDSYDMDDLLLLEFGKDFYMDKER